MTSRNSITKKYFPKSIIILLLFLLGSYTNAYSQTCPTGVSAGSDATICPSITHTLSGSENHALSVSWTTSGDGTFLNGTTLTPTYTPGTNDIINGTATLTLLAQPNPAVCAVPTPVSDFMILTITAAPIVNDITDLSACNNYTLPIITGANLTGNQAYYTQTGGGGTQYIAGDVISTSITLYIYDSNGSCSSEENFSIVILLTPTVNDIVNQAVCDSYTLPVITGTNLSGTQAYYTGNNGGGTQYNNGDVITSTITLYIYDSNGTCDDEENFTITVNSSPAINNIGNQTACDNYTLPVITGTNLTGNQAYYTAINGGGTQFNSGDIITTSQTLYIYDFNGLCSDEENFSITINSSPTVNSIASQTACNSYTLPVITGTNLSGGQAYYTLTGGNGTQYLHGDVISSSTTLYIYDSNGSCSDEQSFAISITYSPTINAGLDQIRCDLLPVSLNAVASNYDPTSILWSTNGNGSFSNATNLITTYTPNAADLAMGTVTLTVEVTGQGACNTTVSNEMVLTLYDAVTVNAGIDAGLCAPSYNLDATTTFASTFQWTTSGDGTFSGSGTIEDPIYTPGANDLINGSAILTLTAQPIAPCSVATQDDMVLTFFTSPTADAGSDATVCATSPAYTLSGALVTGSGTILWTGGDGTFNNSADQNPIYTPGAADIANGSIVLTLTVSNAPCADVVDQMTLTIQPEAIVDAGNNLNICTTDVVNITTATQSNTSLTTWTSSGSGSFSNINILNPTYTPSAADLLLSGVRLTLTGTASAPCAVDASDFMDVTFVSPPTAVAGIDATICETSTFTFTTSSFTNAASITWTTSGDGTFNDDAIQYPTYTPGSNDLITGSATLTLTAIPNAACATPATSSMVLTLEAAPTADAGAAMTICEGNTVDLTAALATDYASLLWTTSGTGSFTNASIQNPVYTPSVDDIAAGSITLTLTANSNSPCAVAAVSSVNITITPLPQVNAGTDASICESSNYTLGATAANYSSVVWTTSGTGTFSNENDVNTSYTPSTNDIGLGSVTLTLTVFGLLPECTAFISDAMVLTFQELPTVDAGIDATICEGSTYTTNPTVTDASSVVWSTTGDGVFANSALPNTVYTPGANDIINGTVDLTLLVNGTSPCASTASNTLTLTILNSPSVNAGPNETICEGAFLVSNAVVTNHSTLLWTSSGSSGTLANQTTLTPTYTPSSADITAGFVDLTLTASPNSPCATSTSDIIRLTVEENPSANAGANATICESGSHTVIGATVANQSTYLWSSSGTGTLINNVNSLTPNYTPSPADLLAGSVTLTITVQPNAPCGIVATDDMLLTFEPLPVVEAGSSATICEGNSYTIIDAVVTNSVSLLWTSSGTGTFTDNSVLNATYNPSAADISTGSVQLTLTAASNAPCISSISDVMDLTIQHLPTANAGTDPTICEGDSYVVSTASATNYSSMSWTSNGTGTFLNGTSLTPSFIPSAADILAGTVTLTLTANSTSPCISTATDAMIITIDPSPAIYAGADQTLCENTIYTINDATASAYTSLQWTSTGSGTLTNANTLTPSYLPDAADAANGTVVLQLTAQPLAPCASSVFDEITLTIEMEPTADAGSDAIVCEGDNYSLTGASATNYISIAWTTTGTGIFSNSSLVTPTYFPSIADYAAGSVDLTMTVTGNAACGTTATSTMTMTFTPDATADAGVNATICETSYYAISSANATNYISLNWTHNGSGSIINAGTLTPQYTPSAADIIAGTVTLTLNATGAGTCGTITDQMVLTITKQPTVSAGADASVCEGNTYSIINALAQNYNTIAWTTSGTGAFSNSGIINPVYTPSSADIAAGAVIITLTATPNSPCGSNIQDFFVLVIEPASVANAGSDASVCEGNSYAVVGSSAQNTSSISWTTSGDGSFVNETTLNPTYTPGTNDIILGTATLTMNTSGNSPCAGDSDDMILSIQKLPTANAGADGSVCVGNDFSLVTTSATNYSMISWTTSGDGTFVNGNTLTPDYTPGPNDIVNGSAALTLNATASAPCLGPISDAMNLTITAEPTAYAGIDSTICFGDIYNITNATTSDYLSLVWNTSGSGTFINNGTIAPTYFPSGPDRASGSVIITLVAYPSSPCATLATDAFVLSFEEGPVVFAGAATNICEGDNYVNTDATASGYNSLLWTSTGTGSFVDATIVNTTYIPSATDIATGVVTLTFTALGNGSCTQDSDNLTITINTSPTADAGTLSEICSSPTIITGATATYYSSLSWTSSGGGSFVNGGTLTPTYTPSASEIAAGTAILTLTATPIGGCGTDAISSIPITIKQAPVIYAGADANTCLGSNYTISDATESNSTSLLWTTNGTGTFTDPSIANPTYTPSAFDETLGAVTLTLTGSSSSCTDQSDQMILTISTTSPTVNAGSDATICAGNSYPISDALAQDYNTISWTTSGTGGFSNANIINPIYTPTPADLIAGAVLITLTATPTDLCSADVDDSFILTFEAASVAYAGADGSVCEGNDYILVNATAANSASVHWTTSGDGAFSDENILEPTYTPGTNDILLGNVVLTITTIGNSPCSGDSDDMTLDIQKLPTVNAGADASVCVGNDYTIVASTATNFGTLSWRTSGDGSFVGGNTLNPVYTPGPNDIINESVLLTIDASSAAPCVGPVSDEMDLNIVSEPTAFSGIDTTICFGEIYDVTNATATNYFSLVWESSGTGTIINNGTLTPTYTPSAQDRTLGSTVITLTANPISPCALPVVSSFILSFREGPVADAGASVGICEGDIYVNTDATASGYTTLLWTTSGTGTFTDASIENTSYIPSPADISTGVVTLTLTAYGDGSCTEASDNLTITINKSPTADAGSLTEICSLPSIVTSASATYYSALAWNTSGDGGFMNGTTIEPTYIPGPTDIFNGTVILTLTASPIGGCGVDAINSITVNINQAAIVYAGADAITCLSSPYTISDATSSNHTSLLWSTSGTGTFSDPTVINPTYTPSVADEGLGSVTLRLTGSSSSCSDEFDEMILSINTISPTVDAGPDAHICEGNTFPIISAMAQDYNAITWTTSGTGAFTNSSIINPVYTPSAADLASGAVLITLTATPNTPCGSTITDAFILSFEAASIAYAGSDASVCEGNDYILSEATAQYTTAINWISSGDGSFSNQTLLNPTYTPGTNDILLGSVTLTINTTGNTPCGGYSDELILSIQKLPTADAGADANICAGNDFVFVSPTATNYSAISWIPSGDGSFTNGNTLTPTYTPGPNDILNGSVTLTLNATSSAPCIGPISDEMILNVISDPTAYSGLDTTICYGDTYTPTNATATDYDGLIWSTSGNGTFITNGTLAPTYFSSPADRASGSIVLTLTANPLSPCASTATHAFVLTFREGPVVEAGAASSICETDSYTNGDAVVSGQTSVLWTTSGTGTFIDATVENTTYNPSVQDIFNGAVTLTLTAQGDGSCAEASDYVTITINKSPSVSAGSMTEICSSPSTIVGASGSNYSSVLWSSSGDGVFINETSLTPTYITGTTDQLNGSVILTITAQPIGGCGVQAVHAIVVTIKDAPVVSAGSDGFVCFGSSYTITDATESFTSDVFWISNGNGTFNDPTLLFPTYTPGTLDAANGVATLSITGLSSSCVDHVDLMVLTINSTVPSVYAGQDTSVCANDSYRVGDALISNYNNLVWTHNGAGTLSDPTTLTPTYTPNIADIGTTVTLSVDAIATTPCASTITDVILLEVKAIPTANAGGPITICEGSTYQFVGSLATNYESLSWSTTGTGTFLNANSYLPEYIPSATDYANGSVIIRLTVSNGPCTDVYNEMILSFSQPAVIDAGNNATVDIGASFTVTTATSSDPTATFLWTTSGSGTFTVGTESTLSPIYTPSALDFANGSVLLTLSATGAAPCSNAVTDYMILTVTDHPPVDFYWVSSCSGDNTEFLIDDVVTDLGSIATYAWDFGDGNTYLSTLPNDASNAYGTSGLYTVTLTATDTAGYTNIVWHYVDVDQAPLPNYSYDQPACSGFTTQFTDHTVAPSGYIVEWHWDFGDGNDTTIYSGGNPNVEYTYANSGTFATSLTVLTSDSCSNAKLINVEITTSPIASFTHDNACFGNITAFTDLSQEGDNIDIVSWEWDFGELTAGLNNYSSEPNAIHQYMTTGDFPVSLTVTNARGCSHTAVDTVTINVPPALDFTYSAVCFDTPIQFTVDTAITDIPNITDWFWDFGDNNTSTDRDPEHVYAVSGTYTVSLTVLDLNACSSTISYTLDVIDLPVANFHFDNPTCEDNMVQFNDYSYTPATTTITEWEWIFGDGDTTIVTPTDNPNVQHLYDTSGVFTVNLLITNSNGCTSSLSKVVTILPPPIADFSSTVTCLNEFVQFTDESLENGSGNIISWEWDFGDQDTGINNNSSSLQNPVHQFSTAGIYTIFLQIENVQGCTDTISQDITINELPAVDFNIYDACLGSDVRFSIDSTISDIGAIASYYWDYGDGNNSNNRDTTSHPYLASGTYTVILSISDTAGCVNSVSHEITVASLPLSIFSTSASQCISDPIQFNDLSTNEDGYIAEWYWDFGDGNDTIILQGSNSNPDISHLYASEGTYIATLTVTNSNGCEGVSTQDITILPGPIASFDFESVCLNVSADFIDLSQANGGGQIIDWDWNFGDPTSGVDNTSTLQNPTHLFNTVGDHEVTLTVANENGCSSTYFDTINISMLPEIDFTTIGGSCIDGVTEFVIDTNLVDLSQIRTIVWDFGDGQTVTNPPQPTTHVYPISGTYQITLTLIDINDCINSITKDVEINPLPDVNFDTDAPSCNGNETQFTDLSLNTSAIDIWYWEFGDGTDTIINWGENISQHPTHIYDTTGTYLARLTITTNEGCSNSFEKEITITPTPRADFYATTTCINHPAQFTDRSSVNGGTIIVDRYWDFGDTDSGLNNNSTQEDPVHQYAVSGKYEVSLTITNAEGCQDTYSDSLIVTLPPTLDPFTFSSNICENSLVEFSMSTNVNLMDVQTILWDFGDPNSADNTSDEQNPTHWYDTPGEYTVTLSLDNDNCGGSIDTVIIVNARPQSVFEVENACFGQSTIFTDYSIHANPIEWLWDFGVLTRTDDTSTVQNPTYIYPELGSDTIRLTIIDSNGCSDTSSQVITIMESPTSAFSYEDNFEDTQGRISLLNESEGATDYEWIFGDGGLSFEENPVHSYTEDGNYDIDLISFNQYNCSDTSTQEYGLIFKGLFIPNAFSPNNPNADVAEFKAVGINLKSYKIEVFDSWGNLIWESTALEEGIPSESWDGTFKNANVPTGVYIWKASGLFEDNTIWEGRDMGIQEGGSGKTFGTVTLIR